MHPFHAAGLYIWELECYARICGVRSIWDKRCCGGFPSSCPARVCVSDSHHMLAEDWSANSEGVHKRNKYWNCEAILRTDVSRWKKTPTRRDITPTKRERERERASKSVTKQRKRATWRNFKGEQRPKARPSTCRCVLHQTRRGRLHEKAKIIVVTGYKNVLPHALRCSEHLRPCRPQTLRPRPCAGVMKANEYVAEARGVRMAETRLKNKHHDERPLSHC